MNWIVFKMKVCELNMKVIICLQKLWNLTSKQQMISIIKSLIEDYVSIPSFNLIILGTQ